MTDDEKGKESLFLEREIAWLLVPFPLVGSNYLPESQEPFLAYRARSISLTDLGYFVLASADPVSRADAPVFSAPSFGKRWTVSSNF